MAFFARFSKPYALYSLFVITYMLFALKAPWFQAEILYYTLLWLSFAFSAECISRPTWYKSIAIGVSFALAHFAKASALPGLGIYVISFAALLIQRFYLQGIAAADFAKAFAHAATPMIVFAVLLFPYFNESKDRYGQYLYNVNSTFYMWYDTWSEAMAGTRRAGDREGWPNLPDEEIPSLAKNLSNHSTADIIRRFHKSAQEFTDNACLRTESSYKFGNCEHSLAGMFILIGSLAMFFYRHRHRTKRIDVQVIFYVASFFGFYVLLSLWYFPMVAGPRVMFALLLPLFWTVGLVERYTEVHKQKLIVFGHAIGPLPFLYSLLILVAVYQVFELAAYRAAQLNGGA